MSETKTPLCDGEGFKVYVIGIGNMEVVPLKFAKHLELRIAELETALELYRGQIDNTGKHSAADALDRAKREGGG